MATAKDKEKETEQMVRDGDSDAVFTTTLASGESIFEGDHFLQKSDRVPIDDLIDALSQYKSFLCSKHQVPKGEYCVAVDKDMAEQLIISCQLVRDPTVEITEATEPENTKLGRAIHNHRQAHKVAETILRKIAKKEIAYMEDYVALLETSCNPKVTEDLLKAAGPKFPVLFTQDGPLKPLTTPLPGTLEAKDALSFRCEVEHVSSPGKFAQIHITQADASSAKILAYVPEIVKVNFSGDSTAHAELLIAQLNEHALWLSASALCSPVDKKKGTMQLFRIQHEKTNTQDFYAQRRQLLQAKRSASLPFNDDEIIE